MITMTVEQVMFAQVASNVHLRARSITVYRDTKDVLTHLGQREFYDEFAVGDVAAVVVQHLGSTIVRMNRVPSESNLQGRSGFSNRGFSDSSRVLCIDVTALRRYAQEEKHKAGRSWYSEGPVGLVATGLLLGVVFNLWRKS